MGYELITENSDSRWYAVWTRSRQEKSAARMLEALGVSHFLPLRTEVREWSDRKQKITVPLFSGYLFVSLNPSKDSKLQILKVPGVAGFVGNQTGPVAIPHEQIEDIRTVLSQEVECNLYPFLEEGDRVRVVRGMLAGVEGRLVRVNSFMRLVISIELIHQSIAVAVARTDVEPIISAPNALPEMQSVPSLIESMRAS